MLHALLEALESAGLGCTIVVARGERLERTYANKALARIFGVDLETMKRLPPFETKRGTERGQFGTLLRSLRGGTEGPRTILTELVRDDGTVVPVEVAFGYSTMNDAKATFVFVRDVSADRAMEAALRESEDRFRKLAEASPDSITIYSEDRYVYANPAALAHLGLRSLDDLKHFDPTSLVAADRKEEISEYVARMRDGERLPPLQQQVRGPDGKDIYFETTLAQMTLNGKPALVSSTRDITERVALQAELIARDRLASVGMLAAGVAHELNNPLTSLAMQTRKLRTDADAHGLSDDVRDSLAQIDEAAHRMKSIIGDLLFMARPSNQPQAHVDVAKILTSTVELLRAGFAHWPHVAMDLEPLPPISGYASKLGQVFLNVLRNAAQAVEGRSDGEIRIRARAGDDFLRIEIEDNGAGIAKDVLPRISQPFFTTRPDGTGLGLWISHGLVEQHRGKLEVTSTLGKGTTVVISLPI